MDQAAATGQDGVWGRISSGREWMRLSPVVPGWVRSWRSLRAAITWALTYGAHVIAFHVVRLPLYALRVALRFPVGVVRLVRAVTAWVFDAEGREVRTQVIRSGDGELYLKLALERRARVRLRLAVTATAVTVIGTAAAIAIGCLSTIVTWSVFACSITILGWFGRPQGRPLLGPVVITTAPPRLTSDVIVRALAALGLAEINKTVARGGEGIRFTAPITRDGPGWRADIDLPYGVTAAEVMGRRDRLASGLRRPLGCVWPEGDTDAHAGRLVLWVGDRDMRRTRQPSWPLATSGQADIFGLLPFGTDPRGRLISLRLMFANLLLGAMPRQGKTAALRLLLLAVALDPRVELRVFELKGTGDLSPLEVVAHHYASGTDNATLTYALHSLRQLYRELELRAARLSSLAASHRGAVPDNKITPELASRRAFHLWPIVAAIDECQELFADPDLGKEAERLATAIIKRGPALGIILLLATQRPDKDSLPTGVSGNVAIRFCLKVAGQVENDMVLGTSAYRNGIRATEFTPELDAGIGYLVGAHPQAQIVRTFYVDGPAAEKIALRARALREKAGTLTGHATGDTTTQPTRTVLDDVLAVYRPGEDRLWSEVIITRLADHNPSQYKDFTPNTLAAALKPYGIAPQQLPGRDDTGTERNKRGYRRDALDHARTTQLPAAPTRRELAPPPASDSTPS